VILKCAPFYAFRPPARFEQSRNVLAPIRAVAATSMGFSTPRDKQNSRPMVIGFSGTQLRHPRLSPRKVDKSSKH
jgi:hypothetical protein